MKIFPWKNFHSPFSFFQKNPARRNGQPAGMSFGFLLFSMKFLIKFEKADLDIPVFDFFEIVEVEEVVVVEETSAADVWIGSMKVLDFPGATTKSAHNNPNAAIPAFLPPLSLSCCRGKLAYVGCSMMRMVFVGADPDPFVHFFSWLFGGACPDPDQGPDPPAALEFAKIILKQLLRKNLNKENSRVKNEEHPVEIPWKPPPTKLNPPKIANKQELTTFLYVLKIDCKASVNADDEWRYALVVPTLRTVAIELQLPTSIPQGDASPELKISYRKYDVLAIDSRQDFGTFFENLNIERKSSWKFLAEPVER
jgi:hypothetical protein